MADNPIQRLLDERRVPWRDSQAALIARHGTIPDPWFGGSPVVPVEMDPPLFPGLLRPLQFEPRPHHNPALPPLRLSGLVWSARGSLLKSRALLSLRVVADSLEPALGKGEAYDTSNTKGLRWRCGPASIEAIAFPRLLNPSASKNPATRVDPRFPDSCWVDVHTGFRLECTPAERAEIESFDPAFSLAEGLDSAWIAANPPSQDGLEYARAPVPGFERTVGRLGRAADGATLVFAAEQLNFVPIAHVDHVHILRAAPARSSGYATLSLACRGDFGDRPLRRVFLAGHVDPNGFDDLAPRIAAWIERPCTFDDQLDD